MGIVAFLFALGNPGFLLGVFMLVAFIIYFISSFKFLHRGILYLQPVTSKLRDWIKVNAYVTLPFAILMFMNSFAVIKNPALLEDSLKQMAEMQKKMGVPVQAASTYTNSLLTVFYIMLFLSVVILVHIMLTFTFLKKYEGLFNPKDESENQE
jgi:hypothetical protein